MSKNLLTIEAFAEWAEKQPAEKRYDYWDTRECACSQYATHIGIVDINLTVHGKFWIAAQEAAGATPRNFGALAARLRALSA